MTEEEILRELATGPDWTMPNLSRAQRAFADARRDLTSRSKDLFADWEGEAAEAARGAAAGLVDSLFSLEKHCMKVEKIVAEANSRRRANAEKALASLPNAGIPAATMRALLQGATVLSPLGTAITLATQGILSNIFAGERQKAAAAALSDVNQAIQRDASTVRKLKVDHITVGEDFGRGPVAPTGPTVGGIGSGLPGSGSGSGSRPNPSGAPIGGGSGGSAGIGVGGGAGGGIDLGGPGTPNIPGGGAGGGGIGGGGIGGGGAGGGIVPLPGVGLRPPTNTRPDLRPIPSLPGSNINGGNNPGGGNPGDAGNGSGGINGNRQPGTGLYRGPSQDSDLNGIGGNSGAGLRGGLGGAAGLAAGARLASSGGGAAGTGAGLPGGGLLGGAGGPGAAGSAPGGTGVGVSGSTTAGAPGSAAGVPGTAGAAGKAPGGGMMPGGGQGGAGKDGKKRSGNGGYIAPKLEEDAERGPAALASRAGSRPKKKRENP